MKYLLLLLLSLNAFAAERMIITDLRDGSIQGNGVFETHALAMERLEKMGKLGKKNWREGEFNLVEANSLYSQVFTEQVFNEQTQLNDEVEVTKYYHPTNWSYTLTDITQVLIDDKAAKGAAKAIRDAIKIKELSIGELKELLK